MTPRRAGRIAASVTVSVVALLAFGRGAAGWSWDVLLNGLLLTALLGAPLAGAAGILTYRWRTLTDAPDPEVARPGDRWIAAVRSELAAIEDPRERRHFARAVVVVVVLRTLTARTWLRAACVAVALALGLLAFSRARLGSGDGVALFTLFVPPLVFFAVGALAARRLGSFSRGLVVTTAVAVLSAIAMLPVAATEAVQWYSQAGVTFLDGEAGAVDSASAAVLDTFNPVFIALHVLFWLPGPVLGAVLGAHARRRSRPSPDGGAGSAR